MEQTAALWNAVELGYRWVQRAAVILKNKEQHPGPTVKRRFGGLLGAISRAAADAGELKPALEHFLKVTRSFWAGLFHCYVIPDLPRTNNDLEHLFGATRYHERRATGRKSASPTLVLRGEVRVVAATVTRIRAYSGDELAPSSIVAWRRRRAQLEKRRHQRVLRYRFRRDPSAYLAELETQLVQEGLPP